MQISLFGLTVFLGAFLLFQIQPLLGRFLVPWFGGTPEVWTACMLFFQLFLLAGYAYAHGLSRLRPPVQAVIHLVLLSAAAVLALKIIPGQALKPSPGGNPILHILWICAVCVGLPYFILSATGPLMQAWISRLNQGFVPYRLYALSNAGSLLALISYPFVFEPLLSRNRQALFWSGGFLLFAVFCALCAIRLFRKTAPEPVDGGSDTSPAEPISKLDLKTRLLWMALPMVASIELLAVTNKITQDIAVVPFLWVLPLCLYLLSFILCFDHQRWYNRPVFMALFILGIIGVIAAWSQEEKIEDVRILIGLYTAMLFFCCMVCHGELYRLKPHPRYLTFYYLMIAAGGALGGFLVAVVAPLIFSTYLELHWGILLAVLFVLLADQKYLKTAQRKAVYITMILIVGGIGTVFQGTLSSGNQIPVHRTRNFFGVLTVWKESPQDPEAYKLLLQHGTTFHGLQFQSPEKKLIPTAYYSPGSGIGRLFKVFPKTQNRKIGIVGLGVGTIAIYGSPTDTIRFYEINPQVERYARQYFTYLSETPAKIEVVPGDARLSMESESPQNYDILVLDAFSSDAVPIHLLTEEAFEIYLRHLAPDGVLAFHISTLHLDLQSVVWKQAEHLGLHSLWLESYPNKSTGALASDWILLSRTTDVLDLPLLKKNATPPYADLSNVDLWTDDHVNLLQILKNTPLQQEEG